MVILMAHTYGNELDHQRIVKLFFFSPVIHFYLLEKSMKSNCFTLKLFWFLFYLLLAPSVLAGSPANNDERLLAEGDGFITLVLEYSPSFASNNEISTINGFALGGLYDHPISWHLYVEGGILMQYSFWAERQQDSNTNNKSAFQLKIPLNVTGAWQVSKNVHLMPFLGIHLKGNLKDWSDIKEDYDMSIDYPELHQLQPRDNKLKKLVLGCQGGVRACFNNTIIMGVSYGTDFTEFRPHCRTQSLGLMVGVKL